MLFSKKVYKSCWQVGKHIYNIVARLRKSRRRDKPPGMDGKTMKCTKKSVNEMLERRDYLKRIYWVQGETGMDVNRPFTLGTAVACYGEDGQCQVIHVNPQNEYEDTRCYYGAVDVTELIERWLTDYEYTRADVVADIAAAITQDMA